MYKIPKNEIKFLNLLKDNELHSYDEIGKIVWGYDIVDKCVRKNIRIQKERIEARFGVQIKTFYDKGLQLLTENVDIVGKMLEDIKEEIEAYLKEIAD